eukprot:UN04107
MKYFNYIDTKEGLISINDNILISMTQSYFMSKDIVTDSNPCYYDKHEIYERIGDGFVIINLILKKFQGYNKVQQKTVLEAIMNNPLWKIDDDWLDLLDYQEKRIECLKLFHKFLTGEKTCMSQN